jgi:MASE1
VAAGVMIAQIGIHIVRYTGIVNSTAFILGNTAEPLLIAGLVEYFVGLHFTIGRLRHLFALFAAAVVGSACLAIGWAVVLRYTLALPVLTTWRDLTVNDSVGVVLIAPLVIGLVEAVRQPPPRSELTESIAAVMLLVAVTGLIIFATAGHLVQIRAGGLAVSDVVVACSPLSSAFFRYGRVPSRHHYHCNDDLRHRSFRGYKHSTNRRR